MQVGSIIAVFFVVWWLSFVAVAPIGTRSQSEVGHVVAGTDPGAPAAPHLVRKLLIATGVTRHDWTIVLGPQQRDAAPLLESMTATFEPI